MTLESGRPWQHDAVRIPSTDEPFRFPGRWVGGGSLILGPLLIASGALLRAPFHFFAPQQLAAYQAHPRSSRPRTASIRSGAWCCASGSSPSRT